MNWPTGCNYQPSTDLQQIDSCPAQVIVAVKSTRLDAMTTPDAACRISTVMLAEVVPGKPPLRKICHERFEPKLTHIPTVPDDRLPVIMVTRTS